MEASCGVVAKGGGGEGSSRGLCPVGFNASSKILISIRIQLLVKPSVKATLVGDTFEMTPHRIPAGKVLSIRTTQAAELVPALGKEMRDCMSLQLSVVMKLEMTWWASVAFKDELPGFDSDRSLELEVPRVPQATFLDPSRKERRGRRRRHPGRSVGPSN